MAKEIRILYLLGIIVWFSSCTPLLKKTYKSFAEYPVPEGDLTEMDYEPQKTSFSFWSPTADEVRLMLFRSKEEGHAYRTVHMQSGENGTWTALVEGDLRNQYYTFNVKIKDKWHGDTPGINAHAVNSAGKRAAIIDMDATDPKGWESDARPHLSSISNAIIYRMHYRDFTSDSTSGNKYGGKYLSLIEKNTHNFSGLATGLAHLKELGVTHVQLAPSYDFADDAINNSRKLHYFYGLQPLNYNVPEGSYASRVDNPSARIREFKQMVMAMHRAGIRVIMEMSFNHVYDAKSSNFEHSSPGYFFRTKGKSLADATRYGNETATERPMMRKFMIESIRYWINEYHIDGFYLDMMGLTDIETMKDIRSAVDVIDPSIIVYGDGTSPEKSVLSADSLAITANVYRTGGVGALSHEFYDALYGSQKSSHKFGFLGGFPGNEETLRFAIGGSIVHPQTRFYRVHDIKRPWALQPMQTFYYLTAPDSYCLVDHLRATLQKITPVQQLKLSELAQTAMLVSQGVPVLYNGDEFLRDKHMIRNSTLFSDSINDIDWRLKTVNSEVFEYVKGLINLRKNHPAFHIGNADMVRKNLQFLETDPNVVAFVLKNHAGGDSWGDIVVVLNTTLRYTKVTVPAGLYTVVCNNGRVNEEGMGRLMGPNIGVSGQTALIMWQ